MAGSPVPAQSTCNYLITTQTRRSLSGSQESARQWSPYGFTAMLEAPERSTTSDPVIAPVELPPQFCPDSPSAAQGHFLAIVLELEP